MKRILTSFINPVICCCLLSTVSLFHVGCSQNSLDYTEIKQINEKVTEAELKKYLKVIKLLPQNKTPTFPSVFAPAPTWSHIRSLPIEDLVNSEQINLSQQWDIQRISDHFGTRNRTLKKSTPAEKHIQGPIYQLYSGSRTGSQSDSVKRKIRIWKRSSRKGTKSSRNSSWRNVPFHRSHWKNGTVLYMKQCGLHA